MAMKFARCRKLMFESGANSGTQTVILAVLEVVLNPWLSVAMGERGQVDVPPIIRVPCAIKAELQRRNSRSGAACGQKKSETARQMAIYENLC